MLESPHIAQSPAQQTAVIRMKIPREQMPQVMGPAIQEVLGAVGAQGIGPIGPLFSRHFRMDPATFDFEVGVPVKAPVTATGRVEPGELPAARVARAVYRGSYEGLGKAWGELDAWVKKEGHTPAEHLWERYLAGPESGSDSTAWRTELNRPLA